jgi:NADH-quinone oxidoreductase subunit L
MLGLIWLIPLLPLVGAAINGLLGRRLQFSEKTIGTIAVGSVALAFLLSVGAVISYSSQAPEPYTTGFSYDWIPGGAVETTQGQEIGKASNLKIEWSYQLDPLSAIFMLIVTGVGLCIFVFAVGYMHGDSGCYRFFAYLGLFEFMMLVLVMGSNFLMMFVGWEGVGLCSYLLIGYYFDKQFAADAARKAFITNRIGDFGFALGVFAIIATFGTATYAEVFEQAKSFPIESLWSWGLMSWIALGLFIGAVGKSAQIPLFVWLPDAMAGPTPVSALIHAATMVTAGLYMLTRCNVIFQHSQTMMLVVAVVGALTALLAATIALTQNDIKKVLAYSTVSQLGFMVLACGVGAFVAAVFHVLTHAFFKALLFLGSGSVIHGLHGEQDMQKMGGLKKYMPKTYWTMLIGVLAICGVFPLSGFWSKDEILWNAVSTTVIPFGWLLWLIATIAAFCTAFYMTRLFVLTFHGEERFRHQEHDEHTIENRKHLRWKIENPHESPPIMWIPLVVLAVFAAISGSVGISKAFTGGKHVGGQLNIVNYLEPVIWQAAGEHGQKNIKIEEQSTKHEYFNLAHTIEEQLHSHTATEFVFIIVSLIVAFAGIGLGYLFYVKKPRLPDMLATRLRPLYELSLNKYWVDELYGMLFTRRTMDAARGVYAVDSKIVDGGVNGAAWITRLTSRLTGGSDKYFIDGLVNAVAILIERLASPLIRKVQTGLTANYALMMVIGLLLAVVVIFGKDILKALSVVGGQ